MLILHRPEKARYMDNKGTPWIMDYAKVQAFIIPGIGFNGRISQLPPASDEKRDL
jgi:hypothetical protein